jgi:phospholipase/lecithinase/hemolysin
MKRSTALIRSAVLTAALGAVSSAQAYSSLIVFGDSLSDTGNVQARANLAGLDVPAEPYFQDRFTNGPVAVEVMAQALGVSLTSHAYGGAYTGLGNRIPAGNLLDGTGMQSQVNQFIASLGSAQADAQALYVLWGGGNDLFTLLEDPSASPTPIFDEAVGNLAHQLGQLYARGARDFFVPLLPDFGNTYDAVTGGPRGTGSRQRPERQLQQPPHRRHATVAGHPGRRRHPAVRHPSRATQHACAAAGAGWQCGRPLLDG